MSFQEVTLEGTVKLDGTLELERKLELPPGRVQVTVTMLPELPKDDPFFQRMQQIWADQKARGFVPRSVEEVEGERRRVRDEWEERMQRIEQNRAEAEAIRRAREQSK